MVQPPTVLVVGIEARIVELMRDVLEVDAPAPLRRDLNSGLNYAAT